MPVIVSCNTDGLDVSDESLCLPSHEQFTDWAIGAVDAVSSNEQTDSVELSLALVDAASMQALNKQYRDKDKPTNVLSFAAMEELALPTQTESALLGDVVICPEIVRDEALAQGKVVEHHYAHLLVHGVLHLFGMDHCDENDAKAMEQTEIRILSWFDIPDPYNPVLNQPI